MILLFLSWVTNVLVPTSNYTAFRKGFVAKDRETLKTQYLFTEIMCINFNDLIFTSIASSAVTLFATQCRARENLSNGGFRVVCVFLGLVDGGENGGRYVCILK